MTDAVLFKIRAARGDNVGLYSAGGANANWTTKGRAWNTLKALHQHISVAPSRTISEYTDSGAEIVTFTEVHSTPLRIL